MSGTGEISRAGDIVSTVEVIDLGSITMRSVAISTPSAALRLGHLLIIMLLGLGFGAPAMAQEILSPTDCAGTINANLSCTSNDIKINAVSQMTVAEGGQAQIATCNEGETGLVDIKLTTQLNANSRYDVLTWFGTEGNDPRGNTLNNCYVSSLPDNPATGAILDLEAGADACLDVNSTPDPVDQYMFQVPFTCVDEMSLDINGDVVMVPDGEADVFALVTWFQNNTLNCGTGTGQSMEPGVNPKCDISLLLGLDIEIITNPGIQIVKTPASQNVAPGGQADFTLTVTNEGDVDLDTVVVTDSDCDAAPTLDSGDDGSDGILGLTETWVYTCSKTNVQAGFTNTASVSAEEVGTDIVVTDDDTAVVNLTAPSIQVVKSPATQAVNPGGTASFSIVVTNTGDTDLVNVELTDALAPDCDTSIGGLTQGSSTAPILCEVTGVAAGFTNQADVTGDPATEGDPVSDSDTAAVTLNSPAVQIVKTPDQSVSPGGTAAFTLTVTNPGDVSLGNVVVTDAMCDANPVLQSGDVGVDGILTTSETWVYTCSTANVQAAFTNMANVTADPVGGGTGVSDSDTADVTMYAPAISVAKNPASQMVAYGGMASFSIVVTNTGDVDLENVELTDALAPGCDTSIGDLAMGASTAPITCNVMNVMVAFTNQADVTGDPVGGGTAVTDMDTAGVTVLPPITKEDVVVPVNNPWALLLLTLMVLAAGWYFRPQGMR